MCKLLVVLALCILGAQAHGYGAVYNDEGDHTPNGYVHGDDTVAYGYAPAVYSNNAVSKGHGDYVKELKSGLHYVNSRGVGESNDYGFYASNVVSADAYGQSAYAPAVYAKSPAVYAKDPAVYATAPAVYAMAPAVYAKAPAVYAKAPTVYVKAPAVYANAPVMYANDAHHVVNADVAHKVDCAQNSDAYYANGVNSYAHGDNSYSKASDNSYAHGYDLGHGDHDGRYRFSGRYSPVTAGHYIGYGNKYDFRQNYPYGYGEMLSYTAPVGHSLESGYNKLETKQPYKYSSAYGYSPLTPVHYKNYNYKNYNTY